MANPKPLKEYHKRAIELKYKGKTYEDIVGILNEEFEKSGVKPKFSQQTVKDWFREDGTLTEAYKKYEQEWDAINKELMLAIRKAGFQVLEENFRTASEMLVALLGSEKDSVKLGAIREIYDRLLGKAKQPVEVGGKVNLDMGKAEHRLDEARKYDNDEGNQN